MDPQGEPKTLYVGNLDPQVTEDLMLAVFSNVGAVKSCKVIRNDGVADPYCFVEFTNSAAAALALETMNKRVCLGKEMRINWAASHGPGGPGGPIVGKPKAKVPASVLAECHHVFVGDLSLEVEAEALRKAFEVFGEIADCVVVRDLATNKSRGYGFVSFMQKLDAQKAIEDMNGAFLGQKAIRTNWATKKVPGSGGPHTGDRREPKLLKYDDVFNQASPSNCTVYCGGLQNADDTLIRRTFTPFGHIVEIRVFKDKGYAFIRYDNKESACNAIVALNCTEVAGSMVRCSWGKEGGGNPSAAAGGGYYDPSGYSNGGMAYDGGCGWQQQGQFYPQAPQHGYYPPVPGYGYPAPGQMQGGYMYGQYPGGYGGYGAPPRPPH